MRPITIALLVVALAGCKDKQKELKDKAEKEQKEMKAKLDKDRGSTEVGKGEDLACQLYYATSRIDTFADDGEALQKKVTAKVGITDEQGRPTPDMKSKIETCNKFNSSHGAWLETVHDAKDARAFIDAHLGEVK